MTFSSSKAHARKTVAILVLFDPYPAICCFFNRTQHKIGLKCSLGSSRAHFFTFYSFSVPSGVPLVSFSLDFGQFWLNFRKISHRVYFDFGSIAFRFCRALVSNSSQYASPHHAGNAGSTTSTAPSRITSTARWRSMRASARRYTYYI